MKAKLCIGIIVMLMVLAVSTQAEECKAHRGAGVLVYSVDGSGQRYVLLGYESHRGWTSFGGGPKYLETLNPNRKWCETRKETALREGLEEMRLLIPRATLAKLLQNAYSFPAQAKDSDFVTFIVKVDKLDTAPYFATPVLSNSEFTETTDIAWISLDQLVDGANGNATTTNTPNGEDLWGVFWSGLSKELRNSNLKTLFP